MSEIVQRQLKYRWRRFVAWIKQNIDAEPAKALCRNGTFSNEFLVNIYSVL
ncbi:hypothetical protein H0X90_31035 [Burkholderia sp. 9775_39]|uniref:hypothetical protein n=1 Tax=unclassified Burkholderia TaxID=2613784 RepID=UPI0018C37384|nr:MULTISPECIES: hypothetical protein [unclassified Burkholderia]MBG0881243.1 hypothetical protein [Burkholderia sp. 9775_39]MBG0887680.1 hypothetical protein [Burkholderia sp. 9773_38]